MQNNVLKHLVLFFCKIIRGAGNQQHVYVHLLINCNWFVSVVKRSADLDNGAKFAQFSGESITEFDIMNFAEVVEFEKNQL